ncbi:MAG: ATP-dependent helicase, partial [Candidatus Saccharimonadales bacterium]
MDEKFQAEYTQLNTQQRQAVDAIDGPVLVVAGPGTGKTQLLSLRVANVLHKTDTDPVSILCLTFTNFAATNMRERLAKLVGPSAHSVMVRTFHSFAAEIMDMYPDYFWNGARLSIAPDAVQLQTIQTILSELPLDNPLALKFAGSYTALNDVQQALKLTKEAGLTPEKLRAMIAVNKAYIDTIESQLVDILSPTLSIKKLPELQAAIEALPDQNIDDSVTPLTSLSTVIKESFAAASEADAVIGKATQTGAWKRRWLQTVNGQKGMFDEKRRNAWWQALAGVYETYRDRLHEQGYYDYSDMIVEVITQLERHPELLASVQERFLYVMIDEFQDTNAAQMRLAHLVATHYASEGKPNLMAVGDDDQSIFAFNGAELNNMLAFRRTYPTTKTIVLEENYRSTQAILDT